MASKKGGKSSRTAKPKTAPAAGSPPPAQPAAPIEHVERTVAGEGPAVEWVRPSGEAGDLGEFLKQANQTAWADHGIPRANDVLIQHLAAAVVRRFPGLTRPPRKPRPQRHDREDAALEKRGRLPHGSIVLAVYDDEAGQWTGLLVNKPPVGLWDMIRYSVQRTCTFHAATWGGLFGLLKRLDGHYRDWLGRQRKK